MLTLAHFCAIRCACHEVDGLESLAAKLSIALLRFTDLIPSDKAYYEAGMDARVFNLHEISKSQIIKLRALGVRVGQRGVRVFEPAAGHL